MRLRNVIVLLAIFCTASAAQSQTLINGAGATFPYPLYSKWFDVYSRVYPGARFNYQSIGSGGGIKQLLSGTVDFGASDAPMNDEQRASAKTKILHFPTVLGAVVVSYNIGGIKERLKLSGPVIADIYLGKISKWNDAVIAQLNPGVNLPDQGIVPCRRSDGSGTTYVFTDYLAKVSAEWKKDVGQGTAVKWPRGIGGKGNEGVAALIQQTPGAIGYVELVYAFNDKLPFAEIRNHDGNWIRASVESVTAAAEGASSQMPEDFRVSITDAAGASSYPIASFTYLLIEQEQRNAAKGKAIVSFLNWMLHEGQALAPELSYAPLPPQIVKAEEEQIKKIVVR